MLSLSLPLLTKYATEFWLIPAVHNVYVVQEEKPWQTDWGGGGTVGCFRINTLVNTLIRKRFYGYLLRMKTVPYKVSNIILTDEDKVQHGNNQSGNMIWRGKEEHGRKWWRRSKVGNTSRDTDGRAWSLANPRKSKTKGSRRHNALNLSEHPKSNCFVHLNHIPHKWKGWKWT
jgi:hypothetical protein